MESSTFFGEYRWDYQTDQEGSKKGSASRNPSPSVDVHDSQSDDPLPCRGSRKGGQDPNFEEKHPKRDEMGLPGPVAGP